MFQGRADRPALFVCPRCELSACTNGGSHDGCDRFHRWRGRHDRPADPPAAGRPQRSQLAVHRAGAAQGRRGAGRTAQRRRCRRSSACPTTRRGKPSSLISSNSVRVIDASTAHRVAEGWTFGFPEMDADQRAKVAAASRVSNPGCWSTGAIGLIRPLVMAGIVPRRRGADHLRHLRLFRRRQIADRRVRGSSCAQPHPRQRPHLRPDPQAQARAGDHEAWRAHRAAGLRADRSAATTRA